MQKKDHEIQTLRDELRKHGAKEMMQPLSNQPACYLFGAGQRDDAAAV